MKIGLEISAELSREGDTQLGAVLRLRPDRIGNSVATAHQLAGIDLGHRAMVREQVGDGTLAPDAGVAGPLDQGDAWKTIGEAVRHVLSGLRCAVEAAPAEIGAANLCRLVSGDLVQKPTHIAQLAVFAFLAAKNHGPGAKATGLLVPARKDLGEVLADQRPIVRAARLDAAEAIAVRHTDVIDIGTTDAVIAQKGVGLLLRHPHFNQRTALLQQRIVSEHSVEASSIELVGGVAPEMGVTGKLVIKTRNEFHFTSARRAVHAGQILAVLKDIIDRGKSLAAQPNDRLAVPLLKIVNEAAAIRVNAISKIAVKNFCVWHFPQHELGHDCAVHAIDPQQVATFAPIQRKGRLMLELARHYAAALAGLVGREDHSIQSFGVTAPSVAALIADCALNDGILSPRA